MVESAYIHIPFCKSKCKYCSFISFCKTDLIKTYIFALSKEIRENYKGEELRTLYFGGGTPSLVEPALIKRIIDQFHLKNNCEITLEINPDDASEEYLSAVKKIGVNRLSFGSQTFDDEILKLIGRRHSASDIVKAVSLAKSTGFKNISVDLIYGLPNQTLSGLKQDLEKFMSLEIQHISTYGLKIEPESAWGKTPPKNLPNEDLQADMYEMLNEFLESRGYRRYEVSNFAKAGRESKHNLNYWNNSEYYGFGVAAHGYVDKVRYYNTSELSKYIDSPTKREFGHIVTKKESLEEEIFLGFRKRSGIDTKRIKELYAVDFETKYKDVLNKYKDYFEKTENGFALNLQGSMLSNIILSEFI